LDQSEVERSGDILVYTEPYASGNTPPTDSAWGTAFGGSWANEGYSDAGVDVDIAYTYAQQNVDQSIFPIFTIATGATIHLKTVLLQTTPQRLQKVLGQGSIATVSPISGTRGHTDLTLDTGLTINRLSAAFDVKHRDGESIRPILWNAQAVGSQSLKFVRTAPVSMTADFEGYPDDLNAGRVLLWRKIVAALP
jgi:hypothetical protein